MFFRLFQELLSTFFIEFVYLFLPNISAALDRCVTIVPLDKEIFTHVTGGEKHEVDLLMRAKFRAEEAFFLIHVENQATAQTDFPKRMFHYFARLTAKYDLPVYPVVLFSYDAPLRPEPNRWVVAFPGKTVLRFEYTVIQLNRLPWLPILGVPVGQGVRPFLFGRQYLRVRTKFMIDSPLHAPAHFAYILPMEPPIDPAIALPMPIGTAFAPFPFASPSVPSVDCERSHGGRVAQVGSIPCSIIPWPFDSWVRKDGGSAGSRIWIKTVVRASLLSLIPDP